MSWIVENTWACSSCGKTDNRGRFMECEICGSPKEAHEKYTMGSPVGPRVTDRERLEQAAAGRHWECAYCQMENRDLEREECAFCGAPRDEQKALEQGFKKYLSGPVPSPRAVKMMSRATTAARHEVVKQRQRKHIHYPDTPETRKPLPKRYLQLAVGALTLLFLGVVLYWLFVPREVSTTVAGIRWDCRTTLQERRTRHDEGWGSPIGAFNVSCHTKQRGTKQCNPRQCNPHSVNYQCNPHSCNCHPVCRDLGNGYSSCSEVCSTCYDTCERTEYDTCYDTCPVYDEWCSYDEHYWPTIAQRRAHGADHALQCPALTADGPLQRVNKHVNYQVRFSRDQDTWTYNPSKLADYKRFAPRATWRIKVNRAGQVWPLRLEP